MRRRHVTKPRLLLRNASRLGRSNCAPPPAWPAFGATKGCARRSYGLLAPVYGWFTEGFATPDLQEPKALLEGLRQ
jgi:hypothetical protein